MEFITVAELKTRLGVTSISIIPEVAGRNKRFASCDNGKNLKVQASLSQDKPIRYMYEKEELFTEGCLTNVTPSSTPDFVL